MLISTLEQFIRLLVPPLAAAGINASTQKSVTSSLEALADALEPFQAMDAQQLADLLKLTQEYRENGTLPDWVLSRQPKVAKPKKVAAPKAPKLGTAEAVTRLRNFQEHTTGLNPDAIDEEIQAISALTAAQLKDVQKEFLGAVIGKTKPELLAAIHKKLDNFQTSRDRIEGISNR